MSKVLLIKSSLLLLLVSQTTSMFSNFESSGEFLEEEKYEKRDSLNSTTIIQDDDEGVGNYSDEIDRNSTGSVSDSEEFYSDQLSDYDLQGDIDNYKKLNLDPDMHMMIENHKNANDYILDDENELEELDLIDNLDVTNVSDKDAADETMHDIDSANDNLDVMQENEGVHADNDYESLIESIYSTSVDDDQKQRENKSLKNSMDRSDFEQILEKNSDRTKEAASKTEARVETEHFLSKMSTLSSIISTIPTLPEKPQFSTQTPTMNTLKTETMQTSPISSTSPTFWSISRVLSRSTMKQIPTTLEPPSNSKTLVTEKDQFFEQNSSSSNPYSINTTVSFSTERPYNEDTFNEILNANTTMTSQVQKDDIPLDQNDDVSPVQSTTTRIEETTLSESESMSVAYQITRTGAKQTATDNNDTGHFEPGNSEDNPEPVHDVLVATDADVVITTLSDRQEFEQLQNSVTNEEEILVKEDVKMMPLSKQNTSQPGLQNILEVDTFLTEQTSIISINENINLLYVIIASIPCVLLLLLSIVWICVKRRSKQRTMRSSRSYVMVSKEDADSSMMTNLTSTATLRTIPDLIPTSARHSAVFLIPGHSMPNINNYDLKDDSVFIGKSLNDVSRDNSPCHEKGDVESARKRWQSDGVEVLDDCQEPMLTGNKWKSEDWEKDQSFMTMLARRLEAVDSKAEITEL